MFEEFSILSRQPEYLHVLLNGFPVYGTVLGAICLFGALILRSRAAQVAALFVLLLSSVAVWPVEEYGEKSEDRVESLVDAPGRDWLKEHEMRAGKVVPIFFVLAGCAFVAVLIPGKFPRLRTTITVLTLIISVVCICGGAWVARAGGQIRHKEFRTGAPPPPSKGEAERRENHRSREGRG